MDIFAHTLWANAVARKANTLGEQHHSKLRFNVGWTAFFGVFPDLFAFTIPFTIAFYNILFGQLPLSFFVDHHGPVAGFNIAGFLYQYSHSIVIWGLMFILVWIIAKRPRYELLGWLLHILIDIPSHSLSFYLTPFLFPISNYVFPYGVSWSNQWYILINYSALLLVWGQIFWKKYKI